MVNKYIGRKLSVLYEDFDNDKLIISLTKPPREKQSINKDSRVVRIKKNMDKCEVIVCNSLE